jgi:DNA-binding HxlR family transcriptional regulator
MANNKPTCKFLLRASRDTLDVIQGKWRIPIVISLTYGNKRFGEILNDIEDISPKMLSQELKSLEMNKIIERTLFDVMPVKTEYSLTPLGLSMNNLLQEISKWGIHFREKIIKN